MFMGSIQNLYSAYHTIHKGMAWQLMFETTTTTLPATHHQQHTLSVLVGVMAKGIRTPLHIDNLNCLYLMRVALTPNTF